MSTEFPWVGFAWGQSAQPLMAAYKAGFDTWLAVMNATLAGAERMRMVQLATDVETQTENHRIAQGLAGCRDVASVVQLQASLMRAYAEAGARYWSSIGELARETQAEVAKVLSSRAGDAGEVMQAVLREAVAAEQAGADRRAA